MASVLGLAAGRNRTVAEGHLSTVAEPLGMRQLTSKACWKSECEHEMEGEEEECEKGEECE